MGSLEPQRRGSLCSTSVGSCCSQEFIPEIVGVLRKDPGPVASLPTNPRMAKVPAECWAATPELVMENSGCRRKSTEGPAGMTRQQYGCPDPQLHVLSQLQLCSQAVLDNRIAQYFSAQTLELSRPSSILATYWVVMCPVESKFFHLVKWNITPSLTGSLLELNARKSVKCLAWLSMWQVFTRVSLLSLGCDFCNSKNPRG